MQNRSLYCSEFLYSCGSSSFSFLFFWNMHRRQLFARVFVYVCVSDGTERGFVSLCFGMQHLPAKIFFFWTHFVENFKLEFFLWNGKHGFEHMIDWFSRGILRLLASGVPSREFYFINKYNLQLEFMCLEWEKQRSTLRPLNWQAKQSSCFFIEHLEW